jgi:site-specific recombinase XerD
MLSLYRRHTKKCVAKKKLKSTELRRCECPLWLLGVDRNEQFHRESLKTTTLAVAYKRLEEAELGLPPALGMVQNITIEDAFSGYTKALLTQVGVKPITISGSVQPVHVSLARFAAHRGIALLKDVDLNFLNDWIGTWNNMAQSTRIMRLRFLRRFFRYALTRKWVNDDPTMELLKPKGTSKGTTQPFSLDHEDKKILAAAEYWEKGRVRSGLSRVSRWSASPRTATALILVLRYTGLRISDAFTFDPRSIQTRTVDGELVYCYFVQSQQKTDNPVFVAIPTEAALQIISAPRLSEQFAFWDGTTELNTWRIQFAQNCLPFVQKVSGVSDIHAHRFRDTFAVDLLANGADIRSVSRLLGHKSVSTTLNYYEHFISSDQESLLRVSMKARKYSGNRVIQFPSLIGKP